MPRSPGSGPFELVRFLEAFDEWIDLEAPASDLRVSVLDWIFTRAEQPYEGVRRQEGFDNLWFGAVPGTVDSSARVVVCSYWIQEAEHRVRCDRFATLRYPI